MSNLTKNSLIKIIVAKEMISYTNINYTEKLKQLYNKWEKSSIEEICEKYNEIELTNINSSNIS